MSKFRCQISISLVGDGARIFGNLGNAGVRLEQVRAIEAPGVTHLKYRVVP